MIPSQVLRRKLLESVSPMRVAWPKPLAEAYIFCSLEITCIRNCE